MRFFSAIKLIAACAGISGAAAVFAHGDAAHGAKKGPVVKEATAWGIAGDAKPGQRKLNVTMDDTMRFSPSSISVKQGETVQLTIKNNGKVMHEFVIGNKKTLDEHAALMVKFPNMEHEEPYMAHVAPGKTGKIVWTFDKAGEFDFACLIAGHYQAGMVGKISVAAK